MIRTLNGLRVATAHLRQIRVFGRLVLRHRVYAARPANELPFIHETFQRRARDAQPLQVARANQPAVHPDYSVLVAAQELTRIAAAGLLPSQNPN